MYESRHYIYLLLEKYNYGSGKAWKTLYFFSYFVDTLVKALYCRYCAVTRKKDEPETFCSDNHKPTLS